MRILITANIHGYLHEFKSLLEEANYNPSKDKLILLGNYFNYGPNQVELIDYLIKLKNDGAIVLSGLYEEKYIDAIINSSSQAEQYITSDRNVFYEYLDDSVLRDKHFKFLVSLKESYALDNYFFSSYEKVVSGYNNFYCINSKDFTDDFLEEENKFGIKFFSKSIGLVDITNRKVFKTLIH